MVTIKNRYFCNAKRLVSYPEHHQTLFLGLFCPKRNPLGKIQFGDYLKLIFLQPAQKNPHKNPI